MRDSLYVSWRGVSSAVLSAALAGAACGGDGDGGGGGDPDDLVDIGDNGNNGNNGNNENNGNNGNDTGEALMGTFDTTVVDPAAQGGVNPNTSVTGTFDGEAVNFEGSVALTAQDPQFGDVIQLQFLQRTSSVAGILIVPRPLYQANVAVSISEATDRSTALFAIGTVGQGGQLTVTGFATSGSVTFTQAGTNIGDAVKGTINMRVEAAGALDQQCAVGCVQAATPACQQCFGTLQTCAQQNQCAQDDTACIGEHCGAAFQTCTGTAANPAQCPAEFFTCMQGC
jgi:hypothetical protein